MAYLLRSLSKRSFNIKIQKFNEINNLSQACFMSSVAGNSEVVENECSISEMPGLSSISMFKGLIFKYMKSKRQPEANQSLGSWKSFKDINGPVFKLSVIGESPVVVLAHPDDIQKLFRNTENNPQKNIFHCMKKVREECENNSFDKNGGLLAENNEEWKRIRMKLQPHLMKPKNIVKYIPQMDEVAKDFMNRISDLQRKYEEMPSNFLEELYKWALESVGTVAINRRLGCLDPNITPDSTQTKLINTVTELFACLAILDYNRKGVQWWKFFPSPTFNKFKKNHDFLLSTVDSKILEVERELKNKNLELKNDNNELTLLEILLRTEGLTRKDVVTFMIDMFGAGVDTTSHTIGFTLYLLARNKKAQERLQEEVDAVLGDGKGSITEDHLARLSYLKACIKESLRIFPIVLGTNRKLNEDVVFGGYKVPKGCTIVTANYISSKDEKFFPRSNEFLPERWLRDKPLGPIHPYASLPFSTGTRMCIGRRIAEQELHIFLARAMHRFNVDYKYKDIKIKTGIIASPTEPLRFQFTERR